MTLKLGHLRQVNLGVSDLGKSVEFYRDTLGIDLIAQYDPPGIAFFQLVETRLLLEGSSSVKGSILYFEVEDIEAAHSALKAKGVEFDSDPHSIFQDSEGTFGPAGGEEWIAFFRDPDGNVLALASRADPSVP